MLPANIDTLKKINAAAIHFPEPLYDTAVITFRKYYFQQLSSKTCPIVGPSCKSLYNHITQFKLIVPKFLWIHFIRNIKFKVTPTRRYEYEK